MSVRLFPTVALNNKVLVLCLSHSKYQVNHPIPENEPALQTVIKMDSYFKIKFVKMGFYLREDLGQERRLVCDKWKEC